MGINALNEIDANGHRESNFRRDVRQLLDMHPMDHDYQILDKIRQLKETAETVGKFNQPVDAIRITKAE